ncbi:MAG: endonuclease III [Candidatus Mcinerneyibacterium aminivorans]|uniref:Endonuclease III n=1 Tax=Candidatus Mcinerneyibacterium aminivorans TaxID=2703815 RepID=A0A5D0MHN9_9BACT|nr:MAG: endonuclease III [Candidatus Mcinerneyibacterium aminivorans]
MNKTAELLLEEIDNKFESIKSELKYNNSWQMMVAVILSAQSTDKIINQVTDKLFEKYPEVSDYVDLDLDELQNLIYSSGFYKNKAKNIKKSAEIICEKYDCKVPDKMEELLKLPGIGRKSANVILHNYFNKVKGIVVDTHVKRVSRRLNFTEHQSAEKIEKDLMKIFDKKHWPAVSNGVVLFGRYICKARNPECGKCNLTRQCKYFQKNMG